MRKLRPRFRLQNETYFPDGASNGNRIPDSTLRMGHTFLDSPQPETASQNFASEWDAVSG